MAKPIVIYRLGSLGDTVVALPCFHAIARAWPDAARLVLTNMPVSSTAAALEVILRPGGLIGGTIAYPVGLRTVGALWRLARRLRATGADTMVYLTAGRGLPIVRRDLLFFRLCGFRTIIGAPASADLHDNRIDPASGEEEPEAERLARTLSALGPIDLHDRASWDLRLTPDERAAADVALMPLGDRPFFAINLGGKVAAKDWGDGNWRALLAALAPVLGGLAVVAVGAIEDAARSAAVLAGWPGPVLDLCGRLEPRESAAALGRARFFVGHDSGPLHLAAAGGTRTVGLFGGYNRPRKWHPYGVGHSPIHDMRGVQAIAVDRVRDTVLGLAAAAAAPTIERRAASWTA